MSELHKALFSEFTHWELWIVQHQSGFRRVSNLIGRNDSLTFRISGVRGAFVLEAVKRQHKRRWPIATEVVDLISLWAYRNVVSVGPFQTPLGYGRRLMPRRCECDSNSRGHNTGEVLSVVSWDYGTDFGIGECLTAAVSIWDDPAYRQPGFSQAYHYAGGQEVDPIHTAAAIFDVFALN